MNSRQQSLAASLRRYQEEADMAAQPGMLPVAMRSTRPDHPMAATMYWNKASGAAYVSVQKLPPPPQGMQYQLWAIADGKPVSIGMLENDVAVNGGMQKVPQAVTAGQAFAVSLEQAGGKPAPTPDQIFLLGKMPA
jgi:anti-sigma-K factor RskA